MNKPSMLDEVKSALAPHTSPRESIDQFFNRQLHERIVGRSLDQPLANIRLLQLSIGEVTVSEEFWSIEQFKVFPLWHTRKTPAKTDVPIVVFRGWQRALLIDGHSRINLWTATGNDGPHRTLVIEPKSDVTDPFKT